MLSIYLQTGFYGKKYSNKFPGDKCHGRSSTIPRMVAHHPKDGHQPEGIVINLTLFGPV